MLKVGMIGLGGIGSVHLEKWGLIPDAEIVAVCDVRSDVAREKTKAFNIPVYDDPDRMLESGHFDIIDICTPSYLHREHALKAIEKGMNVLVEKPVALNSSEAAMVFRKAEERGVKFMVAHVLRFWDEYVLLKKNYMDKTYGKLLNASFWRYSEVPKWSWNNWMLDEKLSGHVPLDLHIHDLDFIVSMLGVPEKTVSCRAGHRTEKGLYDFYSASYIYPDFFVNCEAAWFDAPYPFTAGYRANFEDAVLDFDGSRVRAFMRDGTVKDFDAKTEAGQSRINVPSANAYYEEIAYFTNCVRNNLKVDAMMESEITQVLDIVANGTRNAMPSGKL